MRWVGFEVEILSAVNGGGVFFVFVWLWQGNDQVCQWLFDTYQTQDPELQLVVLRFLPILCGVYLPRVTTCPDEPLAGIVFAVSCARIDFFLCVCFLLLLAILGTPN